MFEIGWSELLVLGVVTLIFVGPKELPALMRTIGRYAGSVRRQANEFKAQFEESLRDMELDEMRKEMEAMQASVNAEIMSASKSVEESKAAVVAPVAASPSSSSLPLEQVDGVKVQDHGLSAAEDGAAGGGMSPATDTAATGKEG